MLAWALCEEFPVDEDDELEGFLKWQPRFEVLDGDATLEGASAHFNMPKTPMLFEASGMGLPVEPCMVRNGVVSLGHLCAVRVDGRVEIMKAGAAEARGIVFGNTSEREAWDKAALQASETAENFDIALKPERRVSLREAWRDVPAAGGVDVQLGAVERLKADMHSEAERVRCGRAATITQVGWEIRMRAAFPAVPKPAPSEWKAGLYDASVAAQGPRLLIHTKGEDVRAGGGERWWFTQVDAQKEHVMDSDGYYMGWEQVAQRMRDALWVDSEGFICKVDSGRLTEEAVGDLPPMLQLLARARLRLAGAKVVHGSPTKSETLTVNVEVVEANLELACIWQARLRVTEAYATDGGVVPVKVLRGKRMTTVRVAAYAVVRHDGESYGGVLSDSESGGVIQELGLKGTSYLAELAAQLRCSMVAGDGARAAVCYDNQSVVEAAWAYRHAHARRAREKYARGWLAEIQTQENRLQAKFSSWQASHVGSPPNEWVDSVVAKYAADFEECERGLPVCWDKAASVRFPAARTSMLQWAKPRADKLVRQRLRQTVEHTLLPRDGDVLLGRMPDEARRALNAAAARRWALADEGARRRAEDAQWRREQRCPAGCDAPCDSLHYVYECQSCEAISLRERLVVAQHEVARIAETKCDIGHHSEVREALAMLNRGRQATTGRISSLRDVPMAATGASRGLTAQQQVLGRTAAGMYDCGGKSCTGRTVRGGVCEGLNPTRVGTRLGTQCAQRQVFRL